MTRICLAVLSLAASAAVAQTGDFDTPNRQLKEQSFSRACDGFAAYLKAAPESPLAREATAKRAAACVRVGKSSWGELQKLATQGEKDFARAWAAGALSESGNGNFDAALPLLKQAAGGEGRQASEARSMLVRGAMQEIERNGYDRQRVEAMAQVVLEHATDANTKGRARYLRAQCHLNDQRTVADAEKEFAELGAGETEWADDALYVLGSRREGEQKFAAALELYDGIVKRFSDVTSNMKSSAVSRAGEIRRKSVSISVYQIELSGMKPTIQLNWRNVRNASWTLKQVDPLTHQGSSPPDVQNDLWAAGAVVSTWSSKLDAPVPYAPGSLEVPLEVRKPGLYVLEVNADGVVARERVLVTQTATLTKTDGKQVLVWVSDVETGVAQPNADVALWQRPDGNSDWKRLTGKTDATGVATFPLGKSDYSMMVWTRAGASWSMSGAGNWYGSSYSKEELAYVLVDRPLYKPGETVGLKVFLRTREVGPSTPLASRAVRLVVSDPTGKKVAEPAVSTNAFGTATFTLPLAKNATLGAWSVRVQDDAVSYRQLAYGFRVEEYKPPEYTVSVEPVGNPKPGEKVTFKVKAAYYSGGPVANAQGRALVNVTGWAHTWSRWPDERGDDEHADPGDDEDRRYRYRGRRHDHFGSIAQHTLPFRTGADGSAEIEVPAQPGLEQQPLQYSVQVFVTDASRREIEGTGSVKVAPNPFFVDVRSEHYLYKPGERVSLQLRAEDANGRSAEPEVLVRLMRVSEEGVASRIAETRTRLLKGRGAVVLDADALGMVRAEVVDATVAAEGAPVLAQTDLWLTSDTRPMAPPSPGFQLYVDRAPLKAGQTVRAMVVTDRPGGHALLSLENEALHLARVVELAGRARFIELPLTAALAPNAWLFASRFEDARFLQAQRPVRVSGSEVELDVKVGLGRAVAEPGTSLTAAISTSNGPPNTGLEVALTVVDEALFAIEKERTDFLSFFGRHQRQLTVRTETTMNQKGFRPRPKPAPKPADAMKAPQGLQPQLAAPPAGGAKAMSEEFSSGAAAPSAPAPVMVPGNESERAMSKKSARKDMADSTDDGVTPGEAPVKVRTDFGSSAGWFSSLTGKVGAPLEQPVKLTDSLTSWKAVATVVSTGPHLGQGHGSVRTAKPLMVRLQAPRFFIENDEVTLSAVVESHLPKATDVEVWISAPGLKELAPARKTLRVEPEQLVRFDARFKVSELGERTIRATVKGGGTSDAMEWKLPALVHGSAQRQFFAGRLRDSFKVEFDLPEKRKASLTRLELTLSPSLLAVMFDGLPYLAQYPYGCVEQTLSRFVPATIARRAVKELNLPAGRVPPDLDDMVQKGLERLSSFQHGDGGWGWWQSDSTNRWMSAYVVYALSLAKEAGVAVNDSVLERGRGYLTSHLGEAQNDPETHVFMVFALSQTGKAPAASLDKIFERRTAYSPKGRALVALALLSAKDKRARVAVENLDDLVKAATARSDAAVGEANDAWSTSAAIEATAFTLMAMVRYDLASPLIAPLTDFLVLRRNGGRWRNTRDTAFAIYALSELARREGASAKTGSFVVFVNGKELERFSFAKGGLDLGAPLVLPDSALRPGKNVLEVKRDASGTGYFAATLDVFNQNDVIKGVGGDVKVKRTYTLLGKPSTEKSAAPTEYGMPVESGTRVRVELELTANKAVEFVMVEDLKPAGFEAVMLRSGPEVCNFACAHAELRSDRVAMFITQVPVGTTHVSYELRAEVPGRFAALPARVEAMYAPEIQATADEMRFEVRDEPTASVAHQ